MSWERKIVRVRNSLGVRIPSQIFQRTRFLEGDQISVEIKDEDTIVLRRNEGGD